MRILPSETQDTGERAAAKALAIIRTCVARGRYRVLRHFTERMERRGLFWPDVQAVLEAAGGAVDDGPDRRGRPKWRVAGRATDGLEVEIVCMLDRDAAGDAAVFITVYWQSGEP